MNSTTLHLAFFYIDACMSSTCIIVVLRTVFPAYLIIMFRKCRYKLSVDLLFSLFYQTVVVDYIKNSI